MATNIVFPESVVKKLNSLPKDIRTKFWDKLEKLLRDPAYPSLRNEKLQGSNQWAFSITMDYRATYVRSDSDIVITAIGTHKDVLGN